MKSLHGVRTMTLAVTVLTLSAFPAKAADPEVVSIRLSGGVFVFEPVAKEITAGQSITWLPVNLPNVIHHLKPESANDAFQDTGEFNARNPPTQSFDQPGEIRYFCEKHPGTMRGVLTVKSASE